MLDDVLTRVFDFLDAQWLASDAANEKCGLQWQFPLSRRARIMMGRLVREVLPGLGSRKGVFGPRNMVFVFVSKALCPRWGDQGG